MKQHSFKYIFNSSTAALVLCEKVVHLPPFYFIPIYLNAYFLHILIFPSISRYLLASFKTAHVF